MSVAGAVISRERRYCERAIATAISFRIAACRSADVTAGLAGETTLQLRCCAKEAWALAYKFHEKLRNLVFAKVRRKIAFFRKSAILFAFFFI
jgi:hypothetical protein